jgi:hypothetical protein
MSEIVPLTAARKLEYFGMTKGVQRNLHADFLHLARRWCDSGHITRESFANSP